jgi:hypothetical protein
MKKPVYTLQGKNNIEIFKDHAEIIIITKNSKTEYRVLIDLEDIDKVKDYSWCKSSDGSVYNAATRIHLRRLLLDYPVEKVTHKDGDKMNCKKSNLEFRTNQGDNEYLIFEDHAEIIVPGTDGNEYHALIDLEDIDKCKGYYWRFHESVGIRCKQTLLHRLLTNCEGKEVIHKNGHKLDNRKENLIALTHSEKTSFCKNKEEFLAEREQQNNKSYVSAPVIEAEPEKVERNYSNIKKISNGYLITLEFKDESYTEFFPTKEEAIEAYDNKVVDIYSDAALDSYHSLVEHFVESDPYGLYK